MFKKVLIGIISGLLLIGLLWLYLVDFSRGKKIEFGVSFSAKYAKELNLNPYQALTDLLDDLRVRKFRLMAYWDEIEKVKDDFNFTELDWQIKEIAKRGGQAVLALGQRLPRWPECHRPAWMATLTNFEQQQELLAFIKAVILRYQNQSAIIAWQVENEPFLKVFGECPDLDKNFYKSEVDLVRSLDHRPVVITESGEISTWLRAAKLADYVGTSVYRMTWNRHWGYFYYPQPPSYYYLKARVVKSITPVKDIFVSEMQMEPWLGKPILQAPLKEQFHSMNLKKFQKNIKYIKKTGLSPVYLWGAEWWYWLKQQGDGSIWDSAKTLWQENI